ncbi:TlpA family protein disulfide reductase [Ferrimonas senticii]|uniref:TlpA family protein disulfide reductase n=1 Tax=Ferrimonas senticii TaxID=394566 RepID=UPI0003FCDCF2|nr:TlpA disulfide reductase family protein [Ferrimonas senticii]
MKIRIIVAFLVLIGCFAGPSVLASDRLSSSNESTPAVDFPLQVNGADSLLALSQQGYVYLDFWASWCGPCRYSFPFMNRLHNELGDKLTVVAVNIDVESSDAEPFLQQYPADFAIHYNPDSDIAEAYQVRGMPSSYLIKDGQIILKHVGFRKEKADDMFNQIADIVK